MKKRIWILLLCLTAEAHADTIINASNFTFVDLLAWQVRESSTENWAQTIPSAGPQVPIQLQATSFDWNTGIRVGAGHVFDQTAYDLTVAFTHYQTTASSQASGIVTSAFDGNYFVNNTNGAHFGPSYHSANIRWQFFYNTIDIDLGKDFKLDPIRPIHPYLGIKAASINQTIYSNWFNPIIPTTFTSAAENLKNDFTGIGPMIGVNTNWPLYTNSHQSFHLIANVAMGLLAGHWNFSEIYTNNTPTTINVHVSSLNGVSPLADGLLGLQWMYQLTKSDISLRLGYEEQIWFNQMQFYSYNMGRLNRPVSLQGGDFEFRYNF